MNREMEEKIQEDIIGRVLERSSFLQQEKDGLLRTRDILDALEEMTDLPRAELEKIAKEVRTSYGQHGGGFFSIRHQILLATFFVLIFLGVPILAIWLI